MMNMTECNQEERRTTPSIIDTNFNSFSTKGSSHDFEEFQMICTTSSIPNPRWIDLPRRRKEKPKLAKFSKKFQLFHKNNEKNTKIFKKI